jgi:subtilisin family serine protease
MPIHATKLRTSGIGLAIALTGVVLVATPSPAGAFGRGFGGPGFGGFAAARGPVAGPRPGRPVGRIPGGRDPGRGPIVPPVVGGGGGVVPVGPGSAQAAGGGNNRGGMPPRGERRFLTDEVITEFAPGTTPQAIDELARRNNLTIVESQTFALTGTRFYRWRIGRGRPVADLIGTLEDDRRVASIQPNYVFTAQNDPTTIASETKGHDAQYALGKLQAEEAHRIATGRNIRIAVIDSEIDAKHPDLDAGIVQSFDALGGDDKPHAHGTAMAGAIAAHGKLLGVAPRAELLASRAFDDSTGEAKGNSFAIFKSLQWAADNGARIVNMSFAGPADPALHRILAAAYDKGIVLIAAAGNAGPASPPLYPAADADVIAVTATDSSDAVFKMANRGQFIAVAAPGVEILALAPGGAYQITTGTSVAAAHVSGVAALLLECKPSLKPADVRKVLVTTAAPSGSTGNPDLAADVVNAYRAVSAVAGSTPGTEEAKQ